MIRPKSSILHDYKPSLSPGSEKKKSWPWFIAGLGLPLLGITVFLTRDVVPELNAAEPAAESVSVEANDVALPAAIPKEVVTEVMDLLVSSAVADIPAEVVPSSANEVMASSEFRVPLTLPPIHEKLDLVIKRGDTLDRLFRRNSLSLGDLAMMMQLPEAAPQLKKLIPGDEVVIEHDEGNLVSFYRELNLTSALQIEKTEQGFVATIVDRPIEARKKLSYGRIETSLFESAMKAGLPDRLVMNLAGIFAWDVDFVLDIRSGDDYYILFEEIYQDGKFVRDGEIVAAEFNNNGRTIQAIRYVDKNGKSDYFTPDGRSVRKAFVRAPVDFTRISSNFNPNRKHPILNTIRAHRGVDYAAPKGTSIKAAGDGKVIFRGVKSGYGNVVILQHGGNITTLYAHMSSFDKNAGINRRVSQGQTIGYVGRTGLATANHLHYEYRLNGVHRNPRTVKLPQAEPISNEYRAEFLASVEPILSELMQYKRTQVAALAD